MTSKPYASGTQAVKRAWCRAPHGEIISARDNEFVIRLQDGELIILEMVTGELAVSRNGELHRHVMSLSETTRVRAWLFSQLG